MAQRTRKGTSAVIQGQVEGWGAATAKAAKEWKENRTKTGSDFSRIADIPDGSYIARVEAITCKVVEKKAQTGKSKEKVGLVEIKYVVSRGKDYNGTTLYAVYFLDRPKSQEMFAKATAGMGYDTSELEIGDIPALASEVTEEKPEVKVQVKNGTYNGEATQNVYCNGLADA